jgi:hypothetical protein
VDLLVDLAALAIGHAIDASSLLRRDMAVSHGARLGAVDLSFPLFKAILFTAGDLTVADAAIDPVLLVILALIDVIHRLRIGVAAYENASGY